MVTKLRLLAALGALGHSGGGGVAECAACQRLHPEGATTVHLRTDGSVHDDEEPDRGDHRPEPFRPLPGPSVRRHFSAGPVVHSPEHEEGLRCHAGNYQLAVEPIIWRNYDQSLPADAIETTVNGHRAA